MKHTHLFFPFVFAVLLGLWGCPAEPEPLPIPPVADTIAEPALSPELQRKADKIDSLLQWSKKRGIFSGSALVAVGGQVIYKGAFGYANFRTKEPLTEQSCFQLASVSKVFTATAIMLLQQDGKLEYDQCVSDLIPDFQYDTITVRHLLNHRSGLPRYMSLADQFTDRYTPIDNHEMLDLFCSPRPQLYFTPGGSFNYLNTNYAMLGLIVEEVSGMSFPEFMQRRVFEPLEMHNTRIFSGKDSTEIPNETAGHKGNRRRPVRGIDYYLNGVVGDKGMYSCVEDLFRFDRALYEGTLLTKENLDAAYTPGSPKIRRDNRYYGFGWRITTYKGNPMIYHNGWWMGFKSTFTRFVDDETTIIVLTNTDRTLEVLPRIKALLYPEGEEPIPDEPF